MFWKYLSLTLLLLSPGSRILIEAAYEGQEEALGDGSRLSAKQTEDELIDSIMNKLLATGHEAPGTEAEAKRDNQAGHYNVHQQQQQQQQQQPQQHKPQNQDGHHQHRPAQPMGSGDKADGKEAQGDATSESAAASSKERNAKGSEPVQHAPPGVAAPLEHSESKETKVIPKEDRNFLIGVAVVLCLGFVGLMMAGVCYYKFKRSAKAASDVEYPAYGVTGPMKERVPSPGDRKLAQSAQMYHYQHQKQQMIAMEKANGDMKHDASDDDSEEDNVEGDYTVYECPGLAPTGEMEVKNPLFRGEDPPPPPGPSDQPTPPRE